MGGHHRPGVERGAWGVRKARVIARRHPERRPYPRGRCGRYHRRCCSHLALRPGYRCAPAVDQTRMRSCTCPVRGWDDAYGSVRCQESRRFGRRHRVGDGNAALPVAGWVGRRVIIRPGPKKRSTHRVPKALQELLAELIVGAYGGLHRRFSRHGTPADRPDASISCDPNRAAALCAYYGEGWCRSGKSKLCRVGLSSSFHAAKSRRPETKYSYELSLLLPKWEICSRIPRDQVGTGSFFDFFLDRTSPTSRGGQHHGPSIASLRHRGRGPEDARGGGWPSRRRVSHG